MASIGWGRGLGGLPSEATSFVGRRGELAHLGGLLGQVRLVTLTGVGGVGKTRLALRAADQARPAFPDGVWWVELSSLRDPALVGHAILEALPLADQTTRPVGEVLAGWLADKRLLLVLDTCEHLIEACVHAVANMLTVAPGLHLLATSRQPLGVRGEHVLVVDPLPATHPDPDHGHAAVSDAALLFAQRAVAAVPDFVLGEGDREVVGCICRHLEGIPLAIELAAAQLPHLALEELERRLYARFELLTAQGTGEEAVLGRHQALRTTIGWSHELCTPLERLLWARLSVFAGGFDAEAAEAVCAGGPLSAQQIPPVLEGLVDKSVVRREGQAGHRSGTARYRMLDTVREFGGQWLGELGEQDWAQRRHQNFYLHLARRGDAAWIGPEQVTWYEHAVAEHTNLRAALDFSLTEPDGRTALELAGALWFFWYCCGFQREGRRYLEQALAANPQLSPARTRALWACAVVANFQGDTAAGLRLGTTCRETAQEQCDPDGERAAAFPIGASLAICGELTEAAAVADQALSIPGRSSGYQEAARLMVHSVRGFVCVQMGEFAQGAAVADELRTECQQRGEQWVRARADCLRALADRGWGDAASAAMHARASLKGSWRLHDTAGAALALDLLASAMAAQGQGEQATRLLGLAQQIWQTIGQPQIGGPFFRAAREACERQARKAIGDAAYEAAYKAGMETDPDTRVPQLM